MLDDHIIDELYDRIARLEKVLEAAKGYMESCPADADLTNEFWKAGLALKAAIAKAEGK